jgi:hypothetical protein
MEMLERCVCGCLVAVLELVSAGVSSRVYGVLELALTSAKGAALRKVVYECKRSSIEALSN